MSITLRNAVRDHVRDVKGAAKGVLLALADYADEEGHCWPSMGRIADEIGITRMTVFRALKWLTEAGYVEVDNQRGRNHTNSYKINVTRCYTQTPKENVTPRSENVTPRSPKCNIVMENVTPRSENVTSRYTNHQELSKNHQDDPPETHHAGAREAEKGATFEQARQALAAVGGSATEGKYATFQRFWRALLAVYPEKGKRFGAWLKDWAMEAIPPDRWEEVVECAERYARSGEVQRGYVASLEKFLEGESWVGYGAAEPLEAEQLKKGGYANGNGNGLGAHAGRGAGGFGGSAKYQSDVASLREEVERRKSRRGNGGVYEGQVLR